MFKPISLYIGLRYTRAKRRNHFISFISLVSMLGIALGVAVLITVLSVMNGFDQQIRNRIFTMVPHITITGMDNTLKNWSTVAKRLQHFPGITASAPLVQGQGLMTREDVSRPVIIVGVLPQFENQVSALHQKFLQGHLSDLKPNQFGLVLGQNLAAYLGVAMGDKVTLIVPQASFTPLGVMPQYRRFKVVGIFKVGTGFGFDDNYAFMHLNDAQKLYALGHRASALQLKTNNLLAVNPITIAIQKKLGFHYQVSNWTDQYGAFYHAVQMEKNMMFFILLLLVAIAAFNLISSLVMLVNDKQSDIAILRTLGATPKTIMNVFIIQGCIVGFVGTLLGTLGGILLSLYVTQIVNFIQNTFHIQLLTSNVYFVNYLPSQLQSGDVIKIVIAALFMCLIATIYPAWRAARVQPAEALRYE